MEPVAISRKLSKAASALRFSSPCAFVYNPLEYARAPYEAYLKSWGMGPRGILLLGMNPGPFGMAQTGVPFGEVSFVRDWLGVSGLVSRPEREHPKRPVLGFSCTRSEVSGARLWGWARERFRTPERFFSRFMVLNYCPLVFMSESGSNLTPDKLAENERNLLLSVCDGALRDLVAYYRPEFVIGVGAWAKMRAREALGVSGPRIESILHPSPASPAANRGWAAAAELEFFRLGVEIQTDGSDLSRS